MHSLYSKGIRVLYGLARPLSHLFLHNSRRVRVLVRAGDKVLLVRSAVGSQRWNLPGGGIKRREDARASAQRELYEETNLKPDLDHLRCVGEERLSLNKRGRGYPYAAIVFYETVYPEVISPRIRRPLEILEVEWFPVANLPPNVNPQVARSLKLAEVSKKA